MPPTETMKSQRKKQSAGMTGTQIAALITLLLINLSILGLIASLLLGPNLLNTVLAYYFVPCFVWYVVDWFLFTRVGGPIKRGVTVWRESLPQDLTPFFRHLSWDIVRDDGFIRTDGKAVIIRGSHSMLWRTSWPYVAYIDLLRDKQRIEYRTPLPSLLILLPFLLSPVGILVVAVMLVSSHFVEKRAITNFITDSMLNHW